MILGIEMEENSIIGNLKIDFSKDAKTPFNTIVIAGENGTGKTTILRTIFSFMNLESFKPMFKLIYEIEGEVFENVVENNQSTPGFHTRIRRSDNKVENIYSNKNNNADSIFKDKFDIRAYGCVYSSAKSEFKTKPIVSSTNSELNTEISDNDENYDYTKIKQMLIDLKNNDDNDWAELSKNQINKPEKDKISYSQFEKNSRIFRFENAFNDFFKPNLIFEGVKRENKQITICFKKNGRSISIDDLSSGEKQIVYRSTYCLKNRDTIKNGLLLIDEPELSLHPKWQEKIISFYQTLFTSDGRQNTQIIIATHSPYILENAFSRSKEIKTIILGENGVNVTSLELKKEIFPQSMGTEANYIAFKRYSLDYVLVLYCKIQIMAQDDGYDDSITDCDKFIYKHVEHDEKMLKFSKYKKNEYKTLPTYVRNAICHPNEDKKFTLEEIRLVTECLRKISLGEI